jgi:hypothetical protein
MPPIALPFLEYAETRCLKPSMTYMFPSGETATWLGALMKYMLFEDRSSKTGIVAASAIPVKSNKTSIALQNSLVQAFAFIFPLKRNYFAIAA